MRSVLPAAVVWLGIVLLACRGGSDDKSTIAPSGGSSGPATSAGAPQESSENVTAPSSAPGQDPTDGESWERQPVPPPPPELDGMALQEVERLHRLMDVDRWNHLGDQGMRFGSRYDEVAEALGVHVGVLKAADDYIHYKRIPALSEALKKRLASDPALQPDYYHPISESALLGTYTVTARIIVSGCRDDADIHQKAQAAAERLASKLPPCSGGFKVGKVEYRCERTGTTGDLGYGLMWARGDETPSKQESCTGLYPKQLPMETARWCQSTWTKGKKLTK